MPDSRTSPSKHRILASPAVALALALAGTGCGGGGGGGGSPTAPIPAPQVVTVQVLDDTFSPRSVTINAGDTVVWVMRGQHPGHTVTERNGTFDSGFVFNNDGDVFSRIFPAGEAGRTFEYACRTHQGCCQMQGSVLVGQSAPPPSPGY